MPVTSSRPLSRRRLLAERNVRRYPPPEDHPGDELLNVSAIWVEFGIHPSTFNARQENRCWPGMRGRRLTAYQRHYLPPTDPPDAWRPENTYLRSDVKDALAKPKPTRGVRQLAGGTAAVNQATAQRQLKVTHTTIRRMVEREQLFAVKGHSPENGRAELHYVVDELKRAKQQRGRPLPDALVIRPSDPRGRPAGRYLRSDVAARRLATAFHQRTRNDGTPADKRAIASARTSLCQWERRGCPRLGGEKLITIREPSTKGPPVAYYAEQQINRLVASVVSGKSPEGAAPGYLTLTDAAAQTNTNGGPALSRTFLFRQIQESAFLPKGRLPAVRRTPLSVSGKGKPQWEILPSDLRRLQEAIHKGRADSGTSSPPRKTTRGSTSARCRST